MSKALTWSKHLIVKRGFNIFNQTIKMYKFHATPFNEILFGMFDVLDTYNSNFTFPLTASSGMNHPDMVEILKSSKNEVAIHGYKHIRYDFISAKKQEEDLSQAVKTFKELKIPYTGHRVPYGTIKTPYETTVAHDDDKVGGVAPDIV